MTEARSTLRDLAPRIQARPEAAAEYFAEAVAVEATLRERTRTFPNDPYVPKYLFNLAQIYRTIGTRKAQVRADDTLDWLVMSFLTNEHVHGGRL